MIMIGVPVGKNHMIDVRTAAYCFAEAMRPDTIWGYLSSRECGFGRSVMVNNLLKNPDATHFYTIDSDVVPPPDTLQKLIDHDIPIVAGIYKQRIGNSSRWSFKTDNDYQFTSTDEPLPEKLFEASCIGGSTLLIKREVLENLSSPCFKVVYNSGNNYEHEDEYFSRIAREAGYKIMVDPTIVCEHYNYVRL